MLKVEMAAAQNSRKYCAGTVITPDYLFKALALYKSLQAFGEIDFYILSVSKGEVKNFWQELRRDFGDIRLLHLSDIYSPEQLQKLEGLYGKNSNELRWVSKSKLMIHLLETFGYDAVAYLDCDLFFYDDYNFLFKELEANAILLTPHWRPISPAVDKIQFHCNFTDGLFNAGFLGANQHGMAALEWWHEMCRLYCERSRERGLFVDQKYLDLMPLYFEKVGILRHLGCNIAEWNRKFLRRQRLNGKIVIEKKWPLVFVHFTSLTINYIESGRDTALEQPLKIYQQALSDAKRQIRVWAVDQRQESS